LFLNRCFWLFENIDKNIDFHINPYHMNPIELIFKKLGELDLPPEVLQNLDVASLISHLGNPHDLEHDLFNQLVNNCGVDMNFAQGVVNEFNLDGFVTELEGYKPPAKPKGLLSRLFGG
jgi:hypothetical protein